MFGLGLIGKGVKSIAAGKSQANLGMQSPHLPDALDRIGRFLFGSTLTWIGVSWYSGYVNQRTVPGGGPKLVLPGAQVVTQNPDRPDPGLSKLFANVGKGSGSSSNAAPTTPSTYSSGNAHAGGFLPAGAMFVVGRKDQGRDGQTNPGGPIIAPGPGQVVHILSDLPGFGPDYPVVYFTGGRYTGKYIYIGHTHSALAQGAKFKTGDVISHTGHGSGVGNATVPGWFEIGFAPGGYPGKTGQPVPF